MTRDKVHDDDDVLGKVKDTMVQTSCVAAETFKTKNNACPALHIILAFVEQCVKYFLCYQ